jgi:hypothetical protein
MKGLDAMVDDDKNPYFQDRKMRRNRPARLEFTVPGRPCSKNAAFTQRKGKGVCLSALAQDFWARVQCAAVQALGHERCLFDRNVSIVVTSHFTRGADSGASIALVKDALQGLVYHNDAIVVFEASFKGLPDKSHPRTEISVWELDGKAASVRIPIPAHWAANFGERTIAARVAALDLRQKSDAFEARFHMRPSARSYRTPEADPWADPGSTSRIPESID